jgi:hypothetical protein
VAVVYYPATTTSTNYTVTFDVAVPSFPKDESGSELIAMSNIRAETQFAGDIPVIAGEGLYIQYGLKILCDSDCDHGDRRDGKIRMFTSKEDRDDFLIRNRLHRYQKIWRAIELPEWRAE